MRQIIRKQFLRLLPFQVLLLVVNAINGIVDSVAASNLIGETAMSAIGLYGPVNHLLYAVSITLVSGSQILCGRYMAKNDRGALRNVFSVNLAFSAILSAVTALGMALMVRTGLTALMVPGAEEQEALNRYFLGMALGVPGLVLGQQLFAFLSLENRTRRTMAATLLCVATNAVCNVLFVAGFGMGVFGLALASVLSYWAFFGVMAAYYIAGKSALHFSAHGLRWGEAGSIVKLGYPGALSRFVEMFRCIIVNALILRYVGAVGLSSFAASNSVMAICWALPFGMTAVSRMLLSVSVGEEDRQVTRDTMQVGIRTGGAIVLGLSLLVAVCAVPLTRLFFRNPSDPVYGMTVTAFRMLPFCMPFSVVQQHFACYYQTMEKKRFASILPIMNGAVDVVLFSMLLMPGLGMTGLYLANILNGVVCLILIWAFSVSENRHLPRGMDDLLAMPMGFGIPEEDTLNFRVRSMADVAEISRDVEDFCLGKGIDARRALLAGLALEEMAGNVVEHGFEGDSEIGIKQVRRTSQNRMKKAVLKRNAEGVSIPVAGPSLSGEARNATPSRKYSAEIRVSVKEDDVILRFRDDCPPFDPGEQLRGNENSAVRQMFDEAHDITMNVGIRLVYGITSSVRYDNVLGLNVLIVYI